MNNYIYNDEDNVPMNESVLEVRKKYCPFKSICPVKNCDLSERDECGWYFKFLDLEQDAKDIEAEQKRLEDE